MNTLEHEFHLPDNTHSDWDDPLVSAADVLRGATCSGVSPSFYSRPRALKLRDRHPTGSHVFYEGFEYQVDYAASERVESGHYVHFATCIGEVRLSVNH